MSALVDPADRFHRHGLELAASAQALDHRATVGPGVDLVVGVPCAGSCRLQESAPLSGSKLLLLLDQLRFELFDQLGHQRLKFRLATSECSFMPNRLIAHAQIGQHQLKGIDSGVAVQGVTLLAWRGYDIGFRPPSKASCFLCLFVQTTSRQALLKPLMVGSFASSEPSADQAGSTWRYPWLSTTVNGVSNKRDS